jgi:hypothetical protein
MKGKWIDSFITRRLTVVDISIGSDDEDDVHHHYHHHDDDKNIKNGVQMF